MSVCAKFRCAALRAKKALGIFRELIPRTTRVAYWDPPSGSKNQLATEHPRRIYLVGLLPTLPQLVLGYVSATFN